MMGLCWKFHRARLIRTMFNKALFRVQQTGHFFIYLLFIYYLLLFLDSDYIANQTQLG